LAISSSTCSCWSVRETRCTTSTHESCTLVLCVETRSSCPSATSRTR
jgi:hypothetical protein